MTAPMPRCRLCRADALTEWIDFGRQPICNRYLADPAEAEASFALVLSQCEHCGLVQLAQSPPATELTPRHSWIAYREPESHLDALAHVIAGLPGLDRDAPVWGVSPKDDTLLERISRLGFRSVYRLDLARDLEICVPHAGVETIQDRLTPARAVALTASRSRPQVLVARHVVEHAHDMQTFLKGLASLLSPGGYLVLEAPDCQKGFETLDATTVWEEHVAYFTPATFPLVFEHIGQTIVHRQSFPDGLEDVLTGIGRAPAATEPGAPRLEKPEADAQVQMFSRGWDSYRRRIAGLLADRRRRGEVIAVYGAGHRACAFVNLLGLGEHISWVVDDDPHKQGLWMPGSRLPIRGPQALLARRVDLCLMSVGPEAEASVIGRSAALVERGVQFASIYPASRRAAIA